MTYRWVVRVALVQVPSKHEQKERIVISSSSAFMTTRSNSRALRSAMTLYCKVVKFMKCDD